MRTGSKSLTFAIGLYECLLQPSLSSVRLIPGCGAALKGETFLKAGAEPD